MASDKRGKVVTLEELSELEAQAEAADRAREADESMGPEAASGAPAIALTFEQLKELFQTAAGSAMTPAQIADIAANAAAKAKMPENKQHPGISVFSHPEGELKHPKEKLKCRMYIAGAPLENQTLEPREIDSLNAVTPGHYRVEATNGSTSVIEVKGQVNSNRQIERMWIVINQEDPNRDHFGKRLWMLTDQFIDANRVQTVAA
jgi:hypothetical protein